LKTDKLDWVLGRWKEVFKTIEFFFQILKFLQVVALDITSSIDLEK